MVSIRILLLLTLCLVAKTMGQEECRRESSFVFYRMLLFKGLVKPSPSNKDEYLKSFGPCNDPDNFVEEAARFYESFGFDGYRFRQDPWSFYNGDDYSLGLIKGEGLRLASAAIFDYSKFLNAKAYIGGWHLETKRDIQRGNRTIPAGSTLRFGPVRFPMHGRIFCITGMYPFFAKPYFPDQRLDPLEYRSQSAEWGSGAIRGVAVRVDRPDGIYWDHNLVGTFPSGE